jgi:hypothetical protein
MWTKVASSLHVVRTRIDCTGGNVLLGVARGQRRTANIRDTSEACRRSR